MTSSTVSRRDLANAIRALSMDAVEKAASGHPGLPLGAADVATELFAGQLKYDASAPEWPDRDRFVLSAGHGSMLLYSLLYLTGYEKMPLSELQNFRQLGSRAAGHPEREPAAGIETTTGPLGQGFANAVGIAIAEARLRSQWGADLVDHRIWTLVGDGCLMEGISYEAASLAGHLSLGRLNAIFDDNAVSIDGSTDLSRSENMLDRFRACGWHVERADGHDGQAVVAALEAAASEPRPSLIACHTRIGWGAPTKEGSAKAHGAPLGADEIAGVRVRMDWPHPPFSIPEAILQEWRSAGGRGRAERRAWEERVRRAGTRGQDFLRSLDSANSPIGEVLAPLVKEWTGQCPQVATRVASNKVLSVLSAGLPNLVGGSADLSESNGTRTPDQTSFTADNKAGSYIHYGVREHAMAAVLNGITLHGGLIAYGGTFLAFSDYCRPSMRLAALMELPVVFVMTHDSIGLGEDGPTHQPVEHAAALRAVPGLRVYRPADAMETLEAWQCALLDKKAPSVLCLTRQKVPFLRTGVDVGREASPTKLGAYLLRKPENRDLTLLASGSEVSIALEAADLLEAKGVEAAVVSMPCWELFRQTDADYRQQVLGRTPRLAVEAAVRMGWDEWLGGCGDFVGMEGFGASAPAGDLYRHFGITAEAVAERALALVASQSN